MRTIWGEFSPLSERGKSCCCSPYDIIDLVVVHLKLGGQREPTAEQQVHQTAEEPLCDGRKRGGGLLQRRRRGRRRNLGGRSGCRVLLCVVLIFVVLDDELRRLLRPFAMTTVLVPSWSLSTTVLLSGTSDDDVAPPQHLPLKHARLALELKHDGQDALQDAQAVQHLLGRIALLRRDADADALDERRREGGDVALWRGGEGVVRDEVEQPRGYHADERGDVLGRLDQCSANFFFPPPDG